MQTRSHLCLLHRLLLVVLCLLFTTHTKYFFIPLVRSLFRMNSLTSFALLFFSYYALII